MMLDILNSLAALRPLAQRLGRRQFPLSLSIPMKIVRFGHWLNTCLTLPQSERLCLALYDLVRLNVELLRQAAKWFRRGRLEMVLPLIHGDVSAVSGTQLILCSDSPGQLFIVS
jgi:hypothetical protein